MTRAFRASRAFRAEQSDSVIRQALVSTLRAGVALPGPTLRQLLIAVGFTEVVLLIGGVTFVTLMSAGAPSAHDLIVFLAIVLVVLVLQAIAIRSVLRPALREQRRVLEVRAKITAVVAEGSLRMVYQPIFRSSDGAQVGVEALARFDDPDGCSDTEQWFAAAAEVVLTEEIELLAVRRALEAAAGLPEPLYLALNVSPSTFVSPALRSTLQACAFPMRRLVLELTEHAVVTDYVPVVERRELLRASGLRIAIDDTGAGFASFRHVVAIAPDIIKIDRSLVTRVDQDPTQEALIAAVLTFAHAVGITVVAEGVETTGQLQRLTQLGVDELQGWLLARPQALENEDVSAPSTSVAR